MDNYDLLFLQVESLIQSREQLKNENQSLRQKLIKLTHERALLLDKNKCAATKIKRIIAHLRDEA